MVNKKTLIPDDFEEALNILEDTVQKLESSDLKLDEAIELFSLGVELAGFCNRKLADAQGQIQKIVEKTGGEAVLTLFDIEEE